MQVLHDYGLDTRISQSLVGLFPQSFGQEGQRMAVIRQVKTRLYTEAVAITPGINQDDHGFTDEILRQELVPKILEVPGIARVAYDLTDKPPGSIEFE